MRNEDKRRKVRLDEEGQWRFSEEEDSSIFALVIWGLITAGIASLMFWLFI